MNELIEAIKAWPIIIQGALGSALFWLILMAGQYVIELSTKLYSKHSTRSRKSFLWSKLAKYDAFIEADSFKISVVLYRSTRHFYKALMWLVLGLITQSFITIGGIIGFLGCLYYLFKAYQLIAPWNDDEKKKDLPELRLNLLNELRELGELQDEKTNK